MSKAGMYIKMAATFTILSVGGPAMLFYLQPTDEELFKRYNPELQRKSLENRQGRQQDFDNFVTKLKEYSKSDRPIWEAAAQDEARTRANSAEEQKKAAAEIQKRRDEIRRQAINGQ
ncbi:Assembly factor cbp4 [Xanthoria calcicola]